MSLLCSLVALLLIVTVSASDEAALLAFKAQLSHSGSLASWNSSTGFCSWEGVTCSQRTPARVVELRLNGTGIAGALSPAIGNLTFLRTLDLGINSLQGDIPASLGRLRRLQRLYLDDNSFSGTLPANLSSCVSITEMRLDNNTLGGRIPAELGQKLTHLALITLRNNIFTGTIPASLANLSHLQFIDLSINQLVGSIPPGLGSIQSMRYFTLARNLINGMIPPSLYNWSSLGLDGNHFTGTIPSSVSNISSLIEVGFDSNRFGGYVPPTLGKLGALQYLNFHYNKLEANDTKGWEFITSLANCSRLEILELSTNLFAGKLPGSIVNLSTTLHALGLSENMISGVIPSALGNLSQLNRLYAYHCNLEGPIPASLGELRNLFALDLSMNHHLNSSIPKEIFKLPSLSYFLDLSYNSFSGPLPSEVGSLKSLNALILSGNQLSQSLKNIKGLSKLNMTMNKFSGNIPVALGSIGNLQELAVAGNVNLCDGAPQLHLAPCPTSHLSKKKKKMSKPLVISLTTAGAILFSLSVILVVWILCKKLKPNQKTLTQNSIADNHYKRIPYDALLRGTNEFSEVNLLGRGSYGAVYKCVLDTEDRTLAVKVFNLGQSRYSKSFEVECEAMRRIRHRCLIKIITSCSSVNHQGQEFKALIFEFMPNGNLDGWLHPKYQEPSTNNTLSLAQRLDIAVDIADAVEYLHNYCQPLVIHCDLKPSNILLAEDMSARVGDFGISRILQENTSEGMQTSYSSTGIRGSIGYVAPEYGEGSAVSTAGDIYSLGILLLEMFTGRSPTKGMFRDSLDLHKFAEDALPDRTLEIADPTMWLHSGQQNNNTSIRIQELLISVLRLGISCSKQHPRDRALTKDATGEMHAIRDAYLKFTGEHEAEREASTREIKKGVA